MRPMARLLCVFVLLCSAAASAEDDAVSAYPFAMCSNGNVLTNPEYITKMLDAGATMCRADVTFGTVRKNPGNDPDAWDFSQLDKMRALRERHPKMHWLVLLGYSAEWAGDPAYEGKPGPGIAAPQRGIKVRPVNDAKNLYGHYVYETVKRYKDVTKYWESWNEPDLSGNGFFKGTGKDFFEYQRVCYLAAKKADPECTVVFAAMCYPTYEGYLHTHGLKPPTPYPPTTSFFEEYLKECVKDPQAKKHSYYFDIMNQHTYSRATDLYDYIAVDRKLMEDYLGEQKPVWVTEYGIVDKAGIFGCSPDEYCDYVLQSFAWASLVGVDKLFHFQLDNSNGHGLYSGMLDGPKPALKTYRDVLVKEFADSEFVAQLHGSKGVGALDGNSPFKGGGQDGYDLFEFRSTDRKRRMLIAFADTPRDVKITIPARAREAVMIDRHGARTTLPARRGTYSVTLKGATNLAGWPAATDNEKAMAMGSPEHLIGGATVVLVEDLR